jgi:cytochrome c biogenesis protein ResB
VDAGETLPRKAAGDTGWSRSITLLGPLRAVWWLFTSLRFATVLLVALSVLSLVGVLIPQVPSAIRGQPALEEMWLKGKEDDLGFLATVMDRLGLFDIFHAGWFSVLLAITVVSTGAYIVSRVPGIWVSITRPRTRVPDRYFELAPVRVSTDSPVDAGGLAGALRRRFYRVEATKETDATYLFADRFQFAQAGTLITHAAVIVFILSAVVSRMDSFEAPLFMAEGETLPVFPVRNPEQLQVKLVDSHGEFAASGQPLEYRSDLEIYRNGELVKTCSSTVNSPCGHDGYRFYQSAWFGFGAALQVRDLATGNVVYRETLALSGQSPAPHVVIRDQAGDVVFEDTMALTEELEAGDVNYRGKLVELPGGRVLSIGLRETSAGRELLVLEPAGAGFEPLAVALREGDTADGSGLTVSYVEETMVPSLITSEVPLPGSPGAAEPVFLQMRGVVYGTDDVAEGDSRPVAAVRDTDLTLVAPGANPLEFAPGESRSVDGYEYTFLGPREFSGIQAKRDRSDYLVWAGAGLMVAGMMMTFWVPRRRLWGKISSSGADFAGQAPGHADYASELRGLVAQVQADKPAERQG